MNRYFLLIAILQLWATIAPVSPITTWVRGSGAPLSADVSLTKSQGPLTVIFLINMVKEGYDDYQRYLRCFFAFSPDELNSRAVWIAVTSGRTSDSCASCGTAPWKRCPRLFLSSIAHMFAICSLARADSVPAHPRGRHRVLRRERGDSVRHGAAEDLEWQRHVLHTNRVHRRRNQPQAAILPQGNWCVLHC